MDGAPFGLAVAAGMLAAVNPCGFALLPAYLSLLVTGNDVPTRGAAIGRALTATAAMTAGFAAVFGIFGLAITPVAGQIQRQLPAVTIGIGVILALLGVWLLAGRSLPGLRLPTGRRAVTRSAASMVMFGAAYAIASLSCTIGPFLAIVVTSFRAGSPAEGSGLFLAYAGGMGVTVGVAAIAVALARDGLLRGMRRAGPLLSRVAGGLLLAAGGYVAYYGWWETRLRSGDTAAADDPVIETAATMQRWLASVIGTAGFAVVAALFGLFIATGLGLAWAARRRKRAG